jgi:hypothetical protein
MGREFEFELDLVALARPREEVHEALQGAGWRVVAQRDRGHALWTIRETVLSPEFATQTPP